MSLPDDLRAAAGGVDRRCKVPRQRRTTLGPVSVQMLLQAADDLERLEKENARLVKCIRWHRSMLWGDHSIGHPADIALYREALGDG